MWESQIKPTDSNRPGVEKSGGGLPGGWCPEKRSANLPWKADEFRLQNHRPDNLYESSKNHFIVSILEPGEKKEKGEIYEGTKVHIGLRGFLGTQD